jgi:hypothetical protein
MPIRIWIRLAEISLTLLLAAAVILSWREARQDRAQLRSQLAAANQALALATSRQQDRDTQLNSTLAAIAAEKKSATTPNEILAGISRELGLPTPLTLDPASPAGKSPPRDGALAVARVFRPASAAAGKRPADTSPQPGPFANTSNASPHDGIHSVANPADPTADPNQLPSAPNAQIPAADLKPLYDYLLDCKACEAKLTAAQSDLADEKLKTATLTKSRDEALKAAKGGSTFQRTIRALKWFALGAAAGALAAQTHR